ncbi:MnmA/TRMU family protein [Rubricoccus marinus]|uniref:tRNA-specific 2-thiouridylase MnmA n=1 Tax=Rubricoccus marinus TaxID=716817 RepID=A0A259U0C3_9BACT|nr:tRNA 2-thiouridine(34) synthase MnmA [Rubricoccus marinus]OZC03400.1 tRNA 2-thiouridine(34) synthase MnmA [Rubricoccus marinus]
MSRHGRVLVAMSGGVDSSVAAALLHEQGYDVVGVTMKTWDHATTGGKAEAQARAKAPGGKQVGCCSLDDMNDARAVAVRLGVPHFIVDIRDEFGSFVIDRFERDYLTGRTPNPCVLCNTHVKWAALLKRADALDCEWIATGHYARVRASGAEVLGGGDVATGGPLAPEAESAAGRSPQATSRRYILSRGVDRNKDQSYALWGVEQAHLARTLLPLGAMTKPDIRALAAEMGHLEVADKKDSYEICFVPDGDYRGWLERRRPGLAERVGGDFVWEASGDVLGQHRGTPFYTVGQRRGLGLAWSEPIYVTRIDPLTETVYLGPREALSGRTVLASDLNWVGVGGFPEETRVTAQVRYKDPGAPALVRQTGEDSVEAVFEAPRSAPAPGQALVLYDGDDVLAGGWIDAAHRDGALEAKRAGASGDGEMHTTLPVLS